MCGINEHANFIGIVDKVGPLIAVHSHHPALWGVSTVGVSPWRLMRFTAAALPTWSKMLFRRSLLPQITTEDGTHLRESSCTLALNVVKTPLICVLISYLLSSRLRLGFATHQNGGRKGFAMTVAPTRPNGYLDFLLGFFTMGVPGLSRGWHHCNLSACSSGFCIMLPGLSPASAARPGRNPVDI